MNTKLTNNPVIKIDDTYITFKHKRSKNRHKVRVMFLNENNEPLKGLNLRKLEKYKSDLKQYKKETSNFKVIPKKFAEPIKPKNEEIKGWSVCDPLDKFEMIFGMRKALLNAFDNYNFPRPFRKLAITTFDRIFGRGVSEPKATFKVLSFEEFKKENLGKLIMIGTGGDLHSINEAKEIFFNPKNENWAKNPPHWFVPPYYMSYDPATNKGIYCKIKDMPVKLHECPPYDTNQDIDKFSELAKKAWEKYKNEKKKQNTPPGLLEFMENAKPRGYSTDLTIEQELFEKSLKESRKLLNEIFNEYME